MTFKQSHLSFPISGGVLFFPLPFFFLLHFCFAFLIQRLAY